MNTIHNCICTCYIYMIIITIHEGDLLILYRWRLKMMTGKKFLKTKLLIISSKSIFIKESQKCSQKIFLRGTRTPLPSPPHPNLTYDLIPIYYYKNKLICILDPSLLGGKSNKYYSCRHWHISKTASQKQFRLKQSTQLDTILHSLILIA